MIRSTHLLDTSVFSQPIKDHPIACALERWKQLGDELACTSAICLAEVLRGLEERQSDKYWVRYRELLGRRYPIVPLDHGAAETYARLSADMRRRGRPKPVMDLLIAATARHNGSLWRR